MKKYLVILTIMLTAVSSTVLADESYRVATLHDYGYQNNVSETSVNKLVDIENSLYGRVYEDQNLISRIERLENTVFNRYYPDYELDRRLSNLIYTYNRRYNNPSLIRRMQNNINSAFYGVPTGFTPPISSDPYYNYNNPYNRYGSSFGSGGWSTYGNGWRSYNTRRGGSTGVHIID